MQRQHTMELLAYRSKDVTQTQQCQHTTELLAYRSKDVTQTQQQRPEWPTITLTWHASKYKIHKLLQRYIRSSFLCLGVTSFER